MKKIIALSVGIMMVTLLAMVFLGACTNPMVEPVPVETPGETYEDVESRNITIDEARKVKAGMTLQEVYSLIGIGKLMIRRSSGALYPFTYDWEVEEDEFLEITFKVDDCDYSEFMAKYGEKFYSPTVDPREGTLYDLLGVWPTVAYAIVYESGDYSKIVEVIVPPDS